MEVILTKDIRILGRAGDIKTVSDGYARNYLIPNGLAVPATPETKRRAELQRKRKISHINQQKEEAIAAKNSIENLIFEIVPKKDKLGKLFGSITKQDIQNFLSQHNIAVSKDAIELDGPIKKTGQFLVPIRLFSEIKAVLRLEVK